MYTVEEILKINSPCKLFENDKTKAKQKLRELLKIYHPDRNYKSTDLYTQATIHIQDLYKEALDMIESGTWKDDNVVIFKGKDGKQYSMKYHINHKLENGYLGECYIGTNSILYIINEDNADLVANMYSRLDDVKYANDNMEKEFKRYLPKILNKFNTQDNKTGILIEKTSDVFSLKDVLNYYNGKMPPKHVAWVLSSLYNMACFLSYNNISHNGITIDNYFISPLYHSGLLLGGWVYAVPIGSKMLGVPEQIYNIMPSNIKSSKIGDNLLDLESIKLIGRTLLGDSTGMSLYQNKDIPKALIDWVRLPSSKDAIEEYSKWNDVIIKSFGERKFTEMNIDINKIYEKIGGIL